MNSTVRLVGTILLVVLVLLEPFIVAGDKHKPSGPAVTESEFDDGEMCGEQRVTLPSRLKQLQGKVWDECFKEMSPQRPIPKDQFHKTVAEIDEEEGWWQCFDACQMKKFMIVDETPKFNLKYIDDVADAFPLIVKDVLRKRLKSCFVNVGPLSNDKQCESHLGYQECVDKVFEEVCGEVHNHQG